MVQGIFQINLKYIAVLCCFGLFSIIAFVPSNSIAKENKKYASLVMDADTGMILHQRHADKKLHPASLTKIMTLLMAFEAIEQGKMHYNTRIRISSHAASMVPSKIGLKPGSSIKAKDAINVLVTKSANDIAVALAEHLGRTERSFAKIMTRKARYIGMKSTTFRNASGLHDPKQITTARDMALLAQYVINKYPRYYKFFNQTSIKYGGKTYRNHNKLLGNYQGMDGMKTGYIRASGFNLVASAKRNNQRIIGVVFGGRSGKTRNDHMASLLDNGFNKIGKLRIAKAKIPLPPRKPLALLAQKQINQGIPVPKANTQLASMGRLIGEGDFDQSKIKRIETGMMAIAAHTGQNRIQQKAPQPSAKPARIQRVALTPSQSPNNQNAKDASQFWSIQVGAFTSRAATDELLAKSIGKLPRRDFSQVTTYIAPLKTNNGWLFRGRLAGLTRTQALSACQYFKECMPIAPQNQ
ncbi:MAG: serine hydrolase [Bdellovibrionales bacterium]